MKRLFILLIIFVLPILSSCKVNNISKEELLNNADDIYDMFLPSNPSVLHTSTFEEKLNTYLRNNNETKKIKVLNNYIAQDISNKYNLDAFSVRYIDNDEIALYISYNDEIYYLGGSYNFNRYSFDFIHFAITDINNDSYKELLITTTLVNKINNSLYSNVVIIDEKSKQYIRTQKIYDSYLYFKEESNKNVGIYKEEQNINSSANKNTLTLVDTIISNDYKITFNSLEERVSTDIYNANVIINPSNINFPVYISGANIGFSTRVNMEYTGETFSYTNRNGYLAGATCKFVNSSIQIKNDNFATTQIITKFVVENSMQINRDYRYSYDNIKPLKEGIYDMVIQYRGKQVVVKNFMQISKD